METEGGDFGLVSGIQDAGVNVGKCGFSAQAPLRSSFHQLRVGCHFRDFSGVKVESVLRLLLW